jgi:autotransporter-associated beta strand protein
VPASGFSFGTLTSATLGGLSGSGSLSLANASAAAVALTVGNNNASATYTGSLSGAGSLTKVGTGTATLAGSNTHSGGTTISGGTLQIGNGGTTGSLAGDVTNNATLNFNGSDTSTYAGVISGTGALTKLGTGTLTLSGTNTYTGGTTVTGGTLQVGTGTTTGSIAGNVVNNAALSFNRSDAIIFVDTIAGNRLPDQTRQRDPHPHRRQHLHWQHNHLRWHLANRQRRHHGRDRRQCREQRRSHLQPIRCGDLHRRNQRNRRAHKSGTGGLTLSGILSYSGQTNVSNGTLEIGTFATSPFHYFTSNISLGSNSTVVFNHEGTLSYLGSVSGGSGSQLIKQGSGTLIASSTTLTPSQVIVSGGTLEIFHMPTATELSLLYRVESGATLAFNTNGIGFNQTGAVGFAGSPLFAGGSFLGLDTQMANGDPGGLTFSQSIFNGTGGSLGLDKLGAGTLFLSAANTFSGPTRVFGGNLTLAHNPRPAKQHPRGARHGILFRHPDGCNNGGPLRFQQSRLDQCLLGQRRPHAGQQQHLVHLRRHSEWCGNLTKAGTGTLALTGANTYSGGTTISAGILQIGAGGTTGSLSGNITNNAALTFTRSDALTYAGVISGTGSLTQSGTGTLTLSGANTYTGGTTISAAPCRSAMEESPGRSWEISLTTPPLVSVTLIL